MTAAMTENLPSFHSTFPDLSELCANSAGFDRHHDRLHGADLFVRDALFPGDPKIRLHSRIASSCHGGREVDEQGRLLVENLVVAC